MGALRGSIEYMYKHITGKDLVSMAFGKPQISTFQFATRSVNVKALAPIFSRFKRVVFRQALHVSAPSLKTIQPLLATMLTLDLLQAPATVAERYTWNRQAP